VASISAQHCRTLPGRPLAEVETPALLVDVARLDANIAALAEFLRRRAPGIRLRPHAKTHKCAEIARRQVAAGAVGVCCQTLGEAEAMAGGGIADILVTNEIADAGKAARLAAIASVATVSVCADDSGQVALLADAAASRGVTLGVLVEVDVGGGRCGVGSAAAALDLAASITRAPGLRFAGLQAYHGRAQHLRTHAEREAAIAGAVAAAEEAADLIRRSGIACPTITGAGTGTFEIEAASATYTELQCGSYVFMDVDYGRNARSAVGGVPDFAHALTVLTTVISRPRPERAVCDAGLKAFSLDSGPPSLALHPGLDFRGASDEHSTLGVDDGSELRIGDRLQLLPGHCDPTVALHDRIIAHENGVVTSVWPVARGW
jgi:D-serine deaminase-like pyridoxal phosphate-dependent protein